MFHTNLKFTSTSSVHIWKRFKTIPTIESSNISDKIATSINLHYDVEYQFLQQSKLSTYHFQRSLPRLPIPKLNKTCERYLKSLKPLLIDESYRKTDEVVKQFQLMDGKILQNLLKEYDLKNKNTSYITKFWFDMYLKDRKPLPINYNPLILMKSDKRNEYNQQLLRTTNLIISSLRFMRSLRTEQLEPEVYHMNPKKTDTEKYRNIMKFIPKPIATYCSYGFNAFPLDMSQYTHLFGTTRIPEMDKDRIYNTAKSKHIIVLRNGHFYVVNVLDNEGYIESSNVILNRINQILNEQIENEKYPMGVLTTLDRNTWASLRHHLIEIGNSKQMKLIDSALFCVCLDSEKNFDINNPIPMIKTNLSGDGTNRWFDKSISLIIGKDGTTAVNFEHAWGDGVAVLRYFNEIYKDSIEKPQCHPDNLKTDLSIKTNSMDKIEKLQFNYDERLKTEILSAKEKHEKILNSLNINFIRNTDITKDLCKLNNSSPDSIMQLIFQLAYKKQYGKYVSTYESCSTAAFLNGRTEAVRPLTNEVKKFCDYLLQTSANSLDSNEMLKLLMSCSSVHQDLIKNAAMGQGFDRHLYAMKIIAEKNTQKIPNLYMDIGYELINYNIISTSTLSSPGIEAGGFGPVVDDGFGIGYSIRNNECGAIVTSYEGKRDGKQFVEYLQESFETIKDILEKSKK